MRDQTEPATAHKRHPSTTVEPFLFLVLEANRLGAGGLRVSLAKVDELTIGRGDARSLRKQDDRRRELIVADAKMSTSHATIARRDGVFHLTDGGSTNGTRRNGAEVTSARLADGDHLQLGQTHFIYREIVDEASRGNAGDLDPSSKAREPLGFATLDPLYAKQLARLARVGASPLPTLLLGETGTGKEVLARAIHRLTGRPGPFLAVNCGAIPENLVEAQLFGHVKGAFSGALRDEPGLFRAAAGGTLLLDEIGDLPPASQAALLRVLQEEEVVPVGGSQTIPIDVRVIAATHAPLDQRMAEGSFRRDLYARLAGFVFEAEPLRERIVDLGLLIAGLVEQGRVVPPPRIELDDEVVSAMLRYRWPMNVRELQQCLAAICVLADDDGLVTLKELPSAIADAEPPATEDAESGLTGPSDEALRRDLLGKLAETHGNVSEVARLMGTARRQVQRWLQRLEIDAESFRQRR